MGLFRLADDPLVVTSVAGGGLRPLRRALLLLLGLAPVLQGSAQAQLVWTLVDPAAPQPAAWSAPAAATPERPPARPAAAAPPLSTATPRSAQPSSQLAAWTPAASTTGVVASPRPGAAASAPLPLTAQVAPQPAGPPPSPEEVRRLRERLRIAPIVKRAQAWPSPSLSPGVPSAFVAGWGDVFLGASAATPGRQRDGVVDGSLNAGFGLGSASKAIAVELSGGCGSIKDFCANGSFTARVGRLLINDKNSRLSLAGAWQNFAQWGNEGRQDNVYYGALSYAVPLQPGRSFAQTLQFNVGVGNSQYAPFVSEGSEAQIGGFASLGVELTKYLGVSAGWSGRGANAQLSLTPFEALPITINLLGSDLFNQTPSGTVGILSVSWGANFLTPSF